MDRSYYNAIAKNNTDILFELDGIVHDFDDAEFLEEHNPFPADHRYRIIINKPPFNKVFKTFQPGVYEKFGSSMVSDIFHEIGRIEHFIRLIKNGGSDEKRRFRYFLNNVEYMKITEDRIVIEGVCSTLMPNFQKPEGYAYSPPK